MEKSIQSQGYRLFSSRFVVSCRPRTDTGMTLPDRPFEKRTSGARAEEIETATPR
jgi:hypothetical protein